MRPGKKHPFQLWVEGKDDKFSIISLVMNHGYDFENDARLPFVKEHEGVDELLEAIGVLAKTSTLERVAIVMDADYGQADRWGQLRHRIPELGATPSATGTVLVRKERPFTLGIWLMPDNVSAGILESFLATLIDDDDTAWSHAKGYIDGAEKLGVAITPFKRDKHRIHAYLALQKEPGLPFGVAITAGALRSSSPLAHQFLTWFKQVFFPGVEVEICLSPSEPHFAVAEGLVFSVLPPYSETTATIAINPNIVEYAENPTPSDLNSEYVTVKGDVEISQFSVVELTDETFSFSMDTESRSEHTFSSEGLVYNIKFLGTKKVNGFLCFQLYVELAKMSPLQKVGTFEFMLQHEDADWLTNSNVYTFDPIVQDGVSIEVIKEQDGTLRFGVNGPLGHSFVLRHQLEKVTWNNPRFLVHLTWGKTSVKLYVDAVLVKEHQV